MYYEINVSKDGKHLFATDKRSIRFYWELEKVYRILEEKFPKEEGYKVTVTKWVEFGEEITDVYAHIKEEQNGEKEE